MRDKMAAQDLRIEGMRRIKGGVFSMGSERFYPEESPVRRVRVSDFWIDATPVTNSQFARFVAATGYVSFAEKAPDPRLYPGMDPTMAKAGSAVFEPPAGPVDLRDPRLWWAFRFGADWRHPAGPQSSISGLEDHPVVHVCCEDAEAYARWVRKSLPTEAEWEYAARGGLEGADYAWGDELAPGGTMLANYWQGGFPHENLKLDGWARTSPVRYYAANGYGLYDMIGNVWEWTRDWYVAANAEKTTRTCCIVENPRGARRDDSYDPADALRTPRKVIKGGSHLCAENYCRRYRPAARYPQTIDTTTSHVGFRCVLRSANQN